MKNPRKFKFQIDEMPMQQCYENPIFHGFIHGYFAGVSLRFSISCIKPIVESI